MALPASPYDQSVTEVKTFVRWGIASLDQAVNDYIASSLYGAERLMFSVDGAPLLWVSVATLDRGHLSATVLAVVKRGSL